MQLTNDLLSRYVGGQMEIQNPKEGYLYRGEIATIILESGHAPDDQILKVTFKWVAKGEGYPPLPNHWVRHSCLDYSASLMIYSVSDIGGGRINLNGWIVGENVTIFPPDGSKLDLSKVEKRA